MAIPYADLFELNEEGLINIEFSRTQAFLLTRQFVKEGKSFFDKL